MYVYGGKDGNFTLYEDEGVNYNYEEGNYSNIPFVYNEAKGTLTIGQREGGFEGMLKNRKFKVVFVNKDNPKAFGDDAPGKTVDYTGEELTIELTDLGKG